MELNNLINGIQDKIGYIINKTWGGQFIQNLKEYEVNILIYILCILFLLYCKLFKKNYFQPLHLAVITILLIVILIFTPIGVRWHRKSKTIFNLNLI